MGVEEWERWVKDDGDWKSTLTIEHNIVCAALDAGWEPLAIDEVTVALPFRAVGASRSVHRVFRRKVQN